MVGQFRAMFSISPRSVCPLPSALNDAHTPGLPLGAECRNEVVGALFLVHDELPLNNSGGSRRHVLRGMEPGALLPGSIVSAKTINSAGRAISKIRRQGRCPIEKDHPGVRLGER